MARVAARVDAGDLSHRMELGGPHDEVRALAHSFDQMLDRLQDAFARQSAFVADASHELRTPLTIVRGQLEVLAMNPHPDAEEVRHVESVVRPEIDRMNRLVEDCRCSPTLRTRTCCAASRSTYRNSSPASWPACRPPPIAGRAGTRHPPW